MTEQCGVKVEVKNVDILEQPPMDHLGVQHYFPGKMTHMSTTIHSLELV